MAWGYRMERRTLTHSHFWNWFCSYTATSDETWSRSGFLRFKPGVILFLRRHTNARVTDAAAALRVRMPTLSEVLKDLVGKRWLIRHRSVTDTRVVHLSLSRRGEVLAQRIEGRVRRVSSQIKYKIVAKPK
jgi:DNA-binding MarR family transcriptional regulator